VKTPEDSGDYEDSTLYIFIDESGNFDFSERGTRHFVMAGVATLRPMESAAHLQALRYKLLSNGHNISNFHASPDSQVVRDVVFETFAGVRGVMTHVVHGCKDRVPKENRFDGGLHSMFALELLRDVLDAFKSSDYKRLVLIFDQALPIARQSTFRSSLKPLLKGLRKPFHLYFQSIRADMNGQIADYIAWSRYVALERGEMRPWDSLSMTLSPSERNLNKKD